MLCFSIPTARYPRPRDIVVSNLTNSALVGKNTFKINLNGASSVVKEPPVVEVILSSGNICPVRIEPSPGNNSWSVKYFISYYPSEDESDDDDLLWPYLNPLHPAPTVTISITVNGVQSDKSPFTLDLKEEMAVGTRVELYNYNRRGTVVSHKRHRFGYSMPASAVAVQWGRDRYPSKKQYNIDDLIVVVPK